MHAFGHVYSTTELIDQLRGRQWNRVDETMHRYIIRMQGLVRKAQILVRKFDYIIVDNQLLLLMSAATIEDLKKAVCRHEKRITDNIDRTRARQTTFSHLKIRLEFTIAT